LGRPSEFVLISVGVRHELPDTPHIRGTDGRILALAEWLAEDRSAHDPGRTARQATLLDALLNEFVRQSKPEPSSELKRVRTHMRENLSAPLMLDELAARAAMSKYHFVRWYKRNTGVTPIRDLRRMRIDAACDLVRGSSEPLKVIAEKTGFCDEYYFSRVFREQMGIPPGAFRRTVSKGRSA
jgi:transcriptional regulator GlxA family with amidase domain